MLSDIKAPRLRRPRRVKGKTYIYTGNRLISKTISTLTTTCHLDFIHSLRSLLFHNLIPFHCYFIARNTVMPYTLQVQNVIIHLFFSTTQQSLIQLRKNRRLSSISDDDPQSAMQLLLIIQSNQER